jgi:hypothetical protein
MPHEQTNQPDTIQSTSHTATKGVTDAGAPSLGSVAADAMHAARHKLGQGADAAKAEWTETVGTISEALRKAGDDLGQTRRAGLAADLAHTAADELDRACDALSGRSARDVVQSVREFGRANPAALIAGSIVAGFALGRFVKLPGPTTEEGAPAGTDAADASRPMEDSVRTAPQGNDWGRQTAAETGRARARPASTSGYAETQASWPDPGTERTDPSSASARSKAEPRPTFGRDTTEKRP